jgi:hypothetical protein
MNPTMYQFLAEDHTRTLRRRAAAARPVELARHASTPAAQWFELTWGTRIDPVTELRARCARAGLRVADETTFSRVTILVAEKPTCPAQAAG